MSRTRLALIVGVAVPALLCALVGLTHPRSLTADSAEYWQNMHIVLIPLFPLIGVAPWLIARRVDRRLGWAAAVLGYGFAIFYTSLDLLAGVGAGAVVLGGEADATSALFAVARGLAAVGAWSLILGTVVAGVAAFLRARLRAIPGAVLAILGASLVYRGHVYFPVGTLSMLLLAAGFTIMAFALTSGSPPVASGGAKPRA